MARAMVAAQEPGATMIGTVGAADSPAAALDDHRHPRTNDRHTANWRGALRDQPRRQPPAMLAEVMASLSEQTI